MKPNSDFLMKRLLRAVIINAAALWLTSQTIEGFSYSGGSKTIGLAAISFGVINLFVRPAVKIFLLPINLLTLGLFGWLINVLMLYLLTLVVSQIKISAFSFSGLEYNGFVIPQIEISTLTTAVLASFLISSLSTFFHWLAK
jgi:putative membrane protein